MNHHVGVGANIFDERSFPRGKTSGFTILQTGQARPLLRNWAASHDAFSTTLIFGVRLHQASTVNDDPSDAFARVFFGTAGNLIQEDDCPSCDVDLCQGMAITVLGNCMLSVELIYDSLFNVGQNLTQPTLEVSLSIAHGMNSQNARRTVKFGSINANTTTVARPIPSFAREAILVNVDGVVPSLRMDQLMAAGGQNISTDFVTKKADQSVLIANGASVHQLTTGATASPSTAVIWRLNL